MNHPPWIFISLFDEWIFSMPLTTIDQVLKKKNQTNKNIIMYIPTELLMANQPRSIIFQRYSICFFLFVRRYYIFYLLIEMVKMNKLFFYMCSIYLRYVGHIHRYSNHYYQSFYSRDDILSSHHNNISHLFNLLLFNLTEIWLSIWKCIYNVAVMEHCLAISFEKVFRFDKPTLTFHKRKWHNQI